MCDCASSHSLLASLFLYIYLGYPLWGVMGVIDLKIYGAACLMIMFEDIDDLMTAFSLLLCYMDLTDYLSLFVQKGKQEMESIELYLKIRNPQGWLLIEHNASISE